jgi:DNA repair protein RadC
MNTITASEIIHTDPFARISTYGTQIFSDEELLASFIGNDAAESIMRHVEGNLIDLGRVSINQLAKLPAMTRKRATMVATMLEIGRRRANSLPKDRVTIQSSSDIANFLQSRLQDFSHEVFVVVYLNRSNRIIQYQVISSGGITGTVADPRIILKKAVELDAINLILSHNHPSGSLKPSKADEELTFKIKEAAKYFDMKVLDHVIVSQEGYYSFADEGIL